MAVIKLGFWKSGSPQITVIAAWMVGSQRKFKRNWGFWLFLFSNILWIVWGWHDRAYALIVLQLCLAFLNIRGALKNTSEENTAFESAKS